MRERRRPKRYKRAQNAVLPDKTLPENWQDHMVEMIRGAVPLDGNWFAGGAILNPVRQIGVYEMMYRHRMYDALVDEVRGLVALLGPDAERVLRAYLAAHPSRSWTLNRVADHMVSFLEAQSAPQAQIEMAQLDHAVQTVFEAVDEPGVRPEELAQVPPLRLNGAVRLLRLSHNVHEIRSAVLTAQPVPAVMSREVPLVVFRRDIRVRHWEIGPAPWALLSGIEAHGDVGRALEEVVATELCTPAQLAADVGGWFRDFAERNLVVVRRA